MVRAERGADYVVADPGADMAHLWTDYTMRKRPRPDGTCKIFDWGGWAYPWDGKPAYETAAGYGH